jgi:ABC-type xylose transport system, permease component
MQLIGVDQNWIKIVKGLVLLAAVVFEIVSKNSNKKKASKKKTAEEATKQLEDVAEKAAEELVAGTTVEADAEPDVEIPEGGIAISESQ